MKLYITGEIDNETVKSVCDTLESYSDGDEITVIFNSLGGYVKDAEYISELLLECKQAGSRITCINSGDVASSATIIWCIGDVRKFSVNNGSFLIHQPYIDEATGTGEELIEYAITLIDLENTLSDLYASFSSKAKDEILERMKQNEPLTSDELVEYGLVTDVI